MKNVIATLALLLFFVATSFAQAEQSLVKSLSVAQSVAVLDLPGEVHSSLWDKDFIRITATIKVTNSSDDILKKLVMVGRYEIQSSEVDGQLLITMPKIEQTVIIKGVELSEIISFEVQMPYHVAPLVKKHGEILNNQAM